MKTWKYYNHAMIPTTAPHEEADTELLNNKSFWKANKNILLARWTTDFDCGYVTNWWYVIKDQPFDLSALKAKHRYEINRGIKNFDVRIINPQEYIDELYKVFIAAYNSWPVKYRPAFTLTDMTDLAKKLAENPSMVCYGAFFRTTGELCGFLQIPTYEFHAELQSQRVKPEYEKYQVNAALIYCSLEDNRSKLESGSYYILDGARNINHETRFQDYLEKYFGFRKAYCKLHITYNPRFRWVVNIIYPFRKILQKLDNIGFIHQINAILYMENLCRENGDK